MLKILQARQQQYVNSELPDIQSGLRKGRKTPHQKLSLSDQKVSNMLLGKSGGQLLIAPERMKLVGPKQKQHSVVDMSDDEIKSIAA